MLVKFKKSAGHFELWMKHADQPQWFFVARRAKIRELVLLLNK